jgi:DNA-binding HxlR family transcriptional regulator
MARKRFNEIKRIVGGISRECSPSRFEDFRAGRDALVTGTQYPMIPPRVDYELTQLGRSLGDPVEPLGPWAQGHVKHIIRARAAFDKKI